MGKKIDVDNLINMLSSENKEKILAALEEVANNIGIIPAEVIEDVISALFFIDLGDHPEMIEVKDKAIKVLSQFGKKIIPYCIKNLAETDMKAALDYARVLGLIGKDAVDPLMEEYQKTESGDTRSFILYALSKVKDKYIVKSLPLIISEASSQNDEIRDTATRTLGKVFETLKPNDVDPILIETIFNILINRVADFKAPIRAKAVRSLAKIAKSDFLSSEKKEKLKIICKRLLGEDENYEWDRAFIVRKEAKEALNYL
jgi:HEAT repeat protein